MTEKKEEYFKQLLGIKEDLEKFAIFLTRNREQASDLVGDTIISGFDVFKNLKKKSSFKNYILKICFRIFIRQKEKRDRMVSIDNDGLGEIYGDSITPEEYYDIKFLYKAIDNLDKVNRELIILSELMGYKHKELAEITGLSVANIKVRIHRAKKELTKQFTDEKSFDYINTSN